MARDLDTLLKEFQALAAASNEPGRLTSAQVDAQLERLFAELMAALASLGSQLGPAGAASTALLVDVFQTQLRATLKQSGPSLERSDKMKQLSEELEVFKRGYIPS
ncbi:MAG TPA: hypothetical protein VK539_26065 [Myxococcaceae bacterium]|nr:hypothetical protein [Myxococcaceae bacterium]